MSFNVFISHSSADAELVHLVASWLQSNGFTPYVAEYDLRPGARLSDKVKAGLASSDCVVLLLTRNATLSPWVNQEIGQAVESSKLIIPIVEEGVNLSGYLEGIEFIRFSRSYPYDAITRAIEYLSFLSVRKTEEERNRALVGLLMGFFGLLTLASASSRQERNRASND